MILAILQARMSSSRLPGKVLEPILGESMIARQVERLRRAKRIDRLVIATSDQPDDDPLAGEAGRIGCDVFRGSLDDVLDRYYRCATAGAPGRTPDHVVRLTGDCPLADPGLIDRLIAFHLDGGSDYASTALEPTWPDGLDAEIMTMASLEATWREATLKSDREHVTPFIYHHPDRFTVAPYKNAIDLSAMRWTVDEPRDLKFVRAVYDALYEANPAFGMDDVLALLAERPELGEINDGIVRNEGYLKSLARDGDSA